MSRLAESNTKHQIQQEYQKSFIPAENDMQQTEPRPQKEDNASTKQSDAVTAVIPSGQQPQESGVNTDGDVVVQKDAQMEGQCDGAAISNSEFFNLRKFFIKKSGMVCDRKKIEKMRKARQIRRLRKWLIPKNAIVALNELQGPGQVEFVLHTVGQTTSAEIVVNNVKYEATGSNKNQAKAKVCEKALRDLAIASMNRMRQQQEARAVTVAASKAAPPVAPPAPSMNETEPDGDSSMHGSDVDDGDEADNLPMEHLAAFALHKLFSEWEKEGFEVPTLRPLKPRAGVAPAETTPVTVSCLPKVAKTTADLPEDATTRHPTALFAYMRPQVAYQDLGCNDDTTNMEFVAALKVDGKEFVGRGRSKKLARKSAAIQACNALFGVEFDISVL